MNPAKFVAVSQRVDVWPERGERRDALDQRLTAWLAAAGFTAVPIPNALLPDNLERLLAAVCPAAIVLSGGNDIGQIPERDRTESTLLDWAQVRQLPALGICRGMQMMGAWSGANLRPAQGHVRTRHRLRGIIEGEVNSFHNLALADCPPGFAVLARSEDGEIEAMRHETLPWEGWMWHPERELDFAPSDLRRLRALAAG